MDCFDSVFPIGCFGPMLQINKAPYCICRDIPLAPPIQQCMLVLSQMLQLKPTAGLEFSTDCPKSSPVWECRQGQQVHKGTHTHTSSTMEAAAVKAVLACGMRILRMAVPEWMACSHAPFVTRHGFSPIIKIKIKIATPQPERQSFSSPRTFNHLSTTCADAAMRLNQLPCRIPRPEEGLKAMNTWPGLIRWGTKKTIK